MVSVFPWYNNNPRISSQIILHRPVKTVPRSFPVSPCYPVQIPTESSEIFPLPGDPSWRKRYCVKVICCAAGLKRSHCLWRQIKSNYMTSVAMKPTHWYWWRQTSVLSLRSVACWRPFFVHELCDNSLIIHLMCSKMLSCLSGTISKHHAKFQSKRFSGCRRKR